jgi:hypothetical protein
VTGACRRNRDTVKLGYHRTMSVQPYKRLISCGLIALAALIGLAWLMTASATATESHGIFTATYKARIKIAGGKVRLITKRNEDGTYTFSYETLPGKLIRLFTDGELTETTVFEVVDGRPRTLEYTLINTIGSRPRNGHVIFDWEADMVIGNYKEKMVDQPLPDNAVDRAMLQILLMADMRNDNLQSRYAAWDKDEFEPVIVERLGRETVTNSLGTFETVILRYSNADGSSSTRLWCAEELGYLPVRIEASDEGSKVLDARLSEIEGNPAG